jgi:cell division protein FtsI/penicillin-binding protein 2
MLAPIAILTLALAALWARMVQVQIFEHEIWAREATNLVRSGTILPFRRGRILDRTGTREIVRDEEVYRVEFVWRDFRREHPLGQVAHARSLLLGRTVSLAETLEHLETHAFDLLRLGPAESRSFVLGEALILGAASCPATDDPQVERRAGRAGDARFYVERLLDLDRAERLELRELAKDSAQHASWMELAAQITGEPPAELEARLTRDLAASRFHLSLLADHLGLPGGLPDLVSLLEARRTRVEDAVADDLFLQASGFRPWRLRPSTLAGAFDLDFIARRLGWDETRMAAWIASRGESWERWLDQGLAPRVLAALRVGEGDAVTRVHAALLSPFQMKEGSGSPRPAVLPQLATALAGPVPVEDQADPFAPIPVQAEPVGEAIRLAGLLGWSGGESSLLRAQSLLDLADPARRVWHAAEQRLVTATLADLDTRLKDAVDECLARRARLAADEARASSHSSGAAGEASRLRFRPERLKLARDRAPYVIRDRGGRPRLLQAAPEYEVIHLLSRHPERYGGFGVRRTTRRLAVAFGPEDRDGHALPIAAPLIGKVRHPYLVDLLRQRRDEAELADLRRKRVRSAQDEARVAVLVRGLLRVGQVQGGSGLEGYLEEELSGRNGYAETQGLAEREDRGVWYLAPEDGVDVVTTLDLDLQIAAERVLAEPEVPWSDPKADKAWFDNPVGAIVLMTPEGDLLAAASAPASTTGELGGVRGEAAIVRDRTLTRPTFQPPGSVFKPFIAAWCLAEGRIAGAVPLEACAALEDRAGFGWRTMACHTRTVGHGKLALKAALQVSCNAYFAQLGDRLDGAALEEICHRFGFGEPTGLRLFDGNSAGDGKRAGLLEQPRMTLLDRGDASGLSPANRRRAANGLAVIEATPVQMARAYAGLATGVLPTVRLVRSLDGVDVPRTSRPVGIDAAALAEVRAALATVATVGSARGRGLDPATLGFTLALKTGSADYRATGPGEPVRKHTWIAGWFPADDPVAIVTVFLHDTSATSTHSAVYITSQFLRDPAVSDYIARAIAEEYR